MPLRPDPESLPDPASLGPDKRLWVGLTLGFATLVAMAIVIHMLVPAGPQRSGGSNSTLPGQPPLMTRQQLLENQQAMPELQGFDPQNPPPNPINSSGPLGNPSAPSTLGTGAITP